MDPTFNPVITGRLGVFREKALQAMVKERQGMQLTESYKSAAKSSPVLS